MNGFPSRLLTAALIIVLLWWGRELLAPLCLACFVALALAPPVTFLSRHIPRGAAALVVMVLFLGVTFGTIYVLADDAARALENMPSSVKQLRETIQQSAKESNGVLGNIDRALDEAQRLWQARPTGEPPPDLRRGLLMLTMRAIGASIGAVTLMFLIFFLLATGDSLNAKLVQLVGRTGSERRITTQAADQIVSHVGYFVVYLIVSGLAVGVATWLAFWALGVAYAPLWGVAAGLLNAIPYLGPAIIMIGAGVAGLVQFQSPGMALAAGGISLAITSVEGMVLSPMLFSRLAKIHPVAVFLSIMFWSWLWGPIGTFLAVPITTSLKAVVDLLPGAVKSSALLADDTAPEPEATPAKAVS